MVKTSTNSDIIYCMALNNKNIFNEISVFESNVESILDSPLDREKIKNTLFQYFEIANFLVSKDDTPENVSNFLVTGQDLIDIELPHDYEPLKKVYKLYSYIKNQCAESIEKSLISQDYDAVTDTLTFALQADVRNICLTDCVVEKFKNNKLYKELISLYKLMFIYDLNPIHFEEIGDLYYITEKYQDALDAYLNCAESSDEYADIYRKLAKVFEKINDNDSRLACLEHAKTIEGGNEL